MISKVIKDWMTTTKQHNFLVLAVTQTRHTSIAEAYFIVCAFLIFIQLHRNELYNKNEKVKLTYFLTLVLGLKNRNVTLEETVTFDADHASC